MTGIARDFRWILKAIWWRFVRRRLLTPDDAQLVLLLVIEQMPRAENRITLSRERRDRYNNPLARIDWRVGEDEFRCFETLQAALLDYWAKSSFSAFGALNSTPPEHWRQQLQEGGDIFHPGGSTRMGTHRSTAVLSANLNTFRIENLYLVSTSAFPSGGGANPSFMLMAFALRAAHRIAHQLGRC